MEPKCFHLTMDSNVEDMVMVSTMVRGLLDQLKVHVRDAEIVELCLLEALVNAVRHAYEDRGGREVRLRMELKPSEIEFEIEDHGERTSRAALEAATNRSVTFDPNEPDTLAEGGRGMLIITQGMDDWDYYRRGKRNVFWMRKVLRSQIEEPA